MKKSVGILFLLLAIVVIDPVGARGIEPDIDPSVKERIINEYYGGNPDAFSGWNNKEPSRFSLKICKKYIVIDRGSVFDGPLYYLNKSDGEVYSTCGGTCMHSKGEKRKECQTKCPPPDLEC